MRVNYRDENRHSENYFRHRIDMRMKQHVLRCTEKKIFREQDRDIREALRFESATEYLREN